jgi:hypothetical protein
MRDTQRKRVYKAEHDSSFYEFKQTIPSDELQEWTENNILSKPWFRKRYGNRYPRVELGRSRGAAYGTSLIRLGVRMRNPWVICHEVAHTLTTGDPGHGAEFTRTFLFLIERVVGKEQAAELERNMRANGVKIKPKSWLPKPTRNPEPYDANKTYKPSRYRAQLKRKRYTIKDVERAARKVNATVKFERATDWRGKPFPADWSVEVKAPHGYKWQVANGAFMGSVGEVSEVSEDGTVLMNACYPESAFGSSERMQEIVELIEQGIDPGDFIVQAATKAVAAQTPKNEGEMKVTIKAITRTDENGWQWETHITRPDQETEVRVYKTGADRKGLYRMVENRWAPVFGDEFTVKGRNSVYGKAKRLAEKELGLAAKVAAA